MPVLKNFKEFVTRGNVFDLAIGVVIGTAFGKIITSFVNDVLMPPIGLVLGGIDFSSFALVLKQQSGGVPVVAVSYGKFLNTVLDFLIVAGCIFVVITLVNSFGKEEAALVVTKDCPECCMAIPIAAKKCGHCQTVLP